MNIYTTTPFATDAYSVEPSDTDTKHFARALAHWCSAYPERDVREIAEDIIASNAGSEDPLSRDEIVDFARVFGIAV